MVATADVQGQPKAAIQTYHDKGQQLVHWEVLLAQLCRDCPATFHLCCYGRSATLSHCVQWSRFFWEEDWKTGNRVLYDTDVGEPVHVDMFSHGLRQP